LKILEDWQDYLASKWIEIINKNSTKNSEAWFNNAIRKYTLKVLDLTKNMTPKEIETLYLKIRNMIK
jgi:hypothetical protein